MLPPPVEILERREGEGGGREGEGGGGREGEREGGREGERERRKWEGGREGGRRVSQ